MALKDNASLALIPAAYKTSKVYSALPTDGDGDFTFSRTGSATRVNKAGLIETMASNEPRLDYPLIDGVVQDCPTLLLEPSRTNLAQRSEDFDNSYWQKVRCTITANQIVSPDGSVTADLLTSTDTSENYCQQNVSSTVSGSKQTSSFFVKKGTSDFCHILLWDVSNDGARQWFDLTNGTLGTSATFGSGVSVDSAQMINYGNGWYRCIVVFNNSNTAVRTRLSASNSNGSTSSTSGKTIYLWGAQLEVGSYATSYIPTENNPSGVTRSADVCNGAGTANDFNDSEGVLFAETSILANDGTFKFISLSNDNTNHQNVVWIYYRSDTNQINFRVVAGGSSSFDDIYTINDATLNAKIALKYKENDFSAWVNGFEVLTDNSGSTFADGTLKTLEFNRPDDINNFYGKTKQLMTFKTALTDSELEQITSWTSFNEMAKGQLYTIE